MSGKDDSPGVVDVEQKQKLDYLLKRKRRLKTQITRCRISLSALTSTSLGENPEEVKGVLELMLKCHEELTEVLLELCDIDSEKYELELEQIGEGYLNDVIAKTTEFLAPKVNGTNRPSDPDPSHSKHTVDVENSERNQTTSSSTIPEAYQIDKDMYQQLKRVGIPVFKGNKSEFPIFKETFNQVVDKLSCSDSFKMLQLRQYLDGEALKAIEGFPASSIGYQAAIKRLDEKYGGQRRDILRHLHAVQHLKPVNFNDVKNIEEFADKLELSIISLKEAGRVEEFQNNSMFYSIARGKLSTANITHYKRWVTLERREENLETLHSWLATEVRLRIEAQEEADGLLSPPVKPGRTRTFATSQNSLDM